MEDKMGPAYRGQLWLKHLTRAPAILPGQHTSVGREKATAVNVTHWVLLVPVFWGSRLPSRPCLKGSFFWENSRLKEMLSFSHGKINKHFKTETWKPKVFAGLGCSSTFHKSEEARAWLRVERSSREQEKSFLPPFIFSA